MPRNYAKEMEWRRSKFRQVAFMAELALVEKFKEHLARHDIKPIEWFRYVVGLSLVPPSNTVDSMHGTIDSKTYNTINSMDTSNGGMVETDTSQKELVKPARKEHKPKATPELVARWREMRDSGMSYAAIAAQSSGYEKTTIRKNLARVKANDDGTGTA